MKFFFAVNDGNLAPQDRKTSREQCGALFKKLTKRNAALRGSAPHPATFEKVDETFYLLAASVSACRRVKPLLRNRHAALPEKDSLF